MSRTTRRKDSKGPGYEYWGRRPFNGYSPSKEIKVMTHRQERRVISKKETIFAAKSEEILL